MIMRIAIPASCDALKGEGLFQERARCRSHRRADEVVRSSNALDVLSIGGQ